MSKTPPERRPSFDAEESATVSLPSVSKPRAEPPPCASERIHVPGYEILDEVGRGGMGVVYRARQMKLNRLVALKMILAGGHASAADLARFRTEAEAVARLQHPNIVQVYEVGEHEGRPYLLAGVLRRRQPRPTSSPARRCLPGRPPRLVEMLARADARRPRQGDLHRDLKPANVLLTEDGHAQDHRLRPGQEARRGGADADRRRHGHALVHGAGTGRRQANEIGPAADVYALGAILYEC